ncbi:MAG: SEC-C domain-containing protein [Oscillospiraceae bacterium]|nr:SEC-C domain-containing protein [Oscillospiraceae bacterium]
MSNNEHCTCGSGLKYKPARSEYEYKKTKTNLIHRRNSSC